MAKSNTVVAPVSVESVESGELALQTSVDALTERTSAGFKAAQAKIVALHAENKELRELVQQLLTTVATLNSKMSQLERKVSEVGSETRKDKFLTALRELCVLRGLPPGTNLPAADIEHHMRIIEARKAPAPMTPVNQAEEEVLF